MLTEYYKDLSSLLHTRHHTPIIVMGDFNAAPDDKRLLNLQTDFGLRDVYEHYHPGQDPGNRIKTN